MIATRFMELRKRRGLMIALILVNIGRHLTSRPAPDVAACTQA